MRKLFFRFSVALLAFVIGLSVASLFRAWRLPAAPQCNAPTSWQRINLDDFSFDAPPDMKNQNARGRDSAIWEFRNGSITLSLDYGMYSNDLSANSNQPGYREQWFMLDGRKAEIVTFRMDDQLAADSSEKDRRYIAAVYFPDVNGAGTQLSVWASCVDLEGQELAKSLLFSIKFK